MNELALLADTAGAQVIDRLMQYRHKISSTYFIGSGKAQAVAERCAEEDIDLVIFDNDLTPAQIKNLDKVIERRILDRSGLILDIFASRAKSRQAKIQVELAQLKYMMPRLTRQWQHLSRQEGGVGSGGAAIGVRGPGETQLEIDRRLIRGRINHLTRELKHVEGYYRIQRKGRSEMFCVSLVGYTNAGKSTVFNAFTDAGTLVEDRLFATLDSTTRAINITSGQKVLLSDTVGFIRKLPHHLISSFKSTLTEVYNANLLMHIVDVSHPHFEDHIGTVNSVLNDLGVGDMPTLLVFNKMDRLQDPGFLNRILTDFPDSISISALNPADIERLRKHLARFIDMTRVEIDLFIPHHDARVLSALYEAGDVIIRVDEPDGVRVTVRLEPSVAGRLDRQLSAYVCRGD